MTKEQHGLRASASLSAVASPQQVWYHLAHPENWKAVSFLLSCSFLSPRNFLFQ